MPEEINRIVTDRARRSAADAVAAMRDENLRAEGIAGRRIHFVGNVMIDTLAASPAERARSTAFAIASRSSTDRYAVLTLHRPSNVDDPRRSSGILTAVRQIAREMPVVFPVHPRTRKRVCGVRLEGELDGVRS